MIVMTSFSYYLDRIIPNPPNFLHFCHDIFMMLYGGSIVLLFNHLFRT